MAQFYTSGEAAKLCGVSLRTVLNWIKAGRLHAHKLPGTRGDNRIAPSDLLAFMQGHHLPVPEELTPIGKPTILVVDDDKAMARSIKRALYNQGLEVHMAHDGFEAGVLFEKIKPTLMTLDLQMPKMDGFEVLKHLEARVHTKILVVSAMESHYLERALTQGADDILSKPFDNQELIRRVNELIHPQET